MGASEREQRRRCDRTGHRPGELSAPVHFHEGDREEGPVRLVGGRGSGPQKSIPWSKWDCFPASGV